MKQSTDYFERVYIFLTEKFLQDRSTEWTNLEACFHPVGEQRSKVLQLKPEKLHELLRFVDEKPSPEVYGSDILYEQQLVHYMMQLNQLIEEDTQENHGLPIIQNERIVEMIHFYYRKSLPSFDLRGNGAKFLCEQVLYHAGI